MKKINKEQASESDDESELDFALPLILDLYLYNYNLGYHPNHETNEDEESSDQEKIPDRVSKLLTLNIFIGYQFKINITFSLPNYLDLICKPGERINFDISVSSKKLLFQNLLNINSFLCLALHKKCDTNNFPQHFRETKGSV